MVSLYLRHVWMEAKDRGIELNKHLINGIRPKRVFKIPVTQGQVDYEIDWLGVQLEERAPAVFNKYLFIGKFEVHPVFNIVPGDIEPWEKVKLYKGKIKVSG